MPFVLLPSSGTTSSRTKICIHSHGGLLANAAVVAADGQLPGDDTLVSASPFTHLFGMLSVHLSLLTGSRQALLPHWDVEAFRTLAEHTGATALFAVPAQLRDLVAGLGSSTPIRLREVRAGGAPVPGALVTVAAERAGAVLLSMAEQPRREIVLAQDAHAVGREEPGASPSDAMLVAPAFEHHALDSSGTQEASQYQAGRAGPDDHDGC